MCTKLLAHYKANMMISYRALSQDMKHGLIVLILRQETKYEVDWNTNRQSCTTKMRVLTLRWHEPINLNTNYIKK